MKPQRRDGGALSPKRLMASPSQSAGYLWRHATPPTKSLIRVHHQGGSRSRRHLGSPRTHAASVALHNQRAVVALACQTQGRGAAFYRSLRYSLAAHPQLPSLGRGPSASIRCSCALLRSLRSFLLSYLRSCCPLLLAARATRLSPRRGHRPLLLGASGATATARDKRDLTSAPLLASTLLHVLSLP